MGEYISNRHTNKLDNRTIDITYKDIRELFYKNERDRRECEEVTKNSYADNNYYSENPSSLRLELYKETLYRDPKTSGFMMQYPHGLIIRQGERNNYYLGENQIYSKTISTLARKLYQFDNEEDKQLYKFIADMRIAEFGMFLFQFDYVQRWARSYGDVLFDVLAQHYGLETSWLDITNDFNVALFFATCYYDQMESKWKPLTYPHEGLLDLIDIIENISQASVFTEEAFDYAFENNDYFVGKDKCKELLRETTILKNERIIIGDRQPYTLSRQRKRNLDRKYEGFSIEKEYGIRLMERRARYGR